MPLGNRGTVRIGTSGPDEERGQIMPWIRHRTRTLPATDTRGQMVRAYGPGREPVTMPWPYTQPHAHNSFAVHLDALHKLVGWDPDDVERQPLIAWVRTYDNGYSWDVLT